MLPGFFSHFRGKPCFTIMYGASFTCLDLTSCRMKRRCLLFGSPPFYSLSFWSICFFVLILSLRLRRLFLIFSHLRSFTPLPGTAIPWRWLWLLSLFTFCT